MNVQTARRSMSLPGVLLRLEGVGGLAGSIVLYSSFGGDLLPFVLLILVPDLSLLGYLVNPRLGALTYNTVHTYVVPGVVLALGLLTNTPVMSQIACIWFAHISMDRTVGFGLKYPNESKESHLQRV